MTISDWLKSFTKAALDKRKQARLEQRLNKPLRIWGISRCVAQLQRRWIEDGSYEARMRRSRVKRS